jgi:hypothetical protein
MFFMQLVNSLNRYFRKHRVFAFVFMFVAGGLFIAFGINQILDLHHTFRQHSAFVYEEFGFWLLILIPAALYLNSQRKVSSRTTRGRQLIFVFLVPIALALPYIEGWNLYSADAYWMAVPGDTLIICCAAVATLSNMWQILTIKSTQGQRLK